MFKSELRFIFVLAIGGPLLVVACILYVVRLRDDLRQCEARPAIVHAWRSLDGGGVCLTPFKCGEDNESTLIFGDTAKGGAMCACMAMTEKPKGVRIR